MPQIRPTVASDHMGVHGILDPVELGAGPPKSSGVYAAMHTAAAYLYSTFVTNQCN